MLECFNIGKPVTLNPMKLLSKEKKKKELFKNILIGFSSKY